MNETMLFGGGSGGDNEGEGRGGGFFTVGGKGFKRNVKPYVAGGRHAKSYAKKLRTSRASKRR